MREWIYKILSSPTFLIGVVGFFVVSLAFLIRLENDTSHVQDNVIDLKKSVSEVHTSVGEVKANQQRILDALDNIEVAMGNHVHEADGTVSVPLPSH